MRYLRLRERRADSPLLCRVLYRVAMREKLWQEHIVQPEDARICSIISLASPYANYKTSIERFRNCGETDNFSGDKSWLRPPRDTRLGCRMAALFIDCWLLRKQK